MPLLLGMILGAILTIAGAYAYDTSTGQAANGLSPSTGGHPPLVNWAVVSDDWQGLQTSVRNISDDLQKRFKRG